MQGSDEIYNQNYVYFALKNCLYVHNQRNENMSIYSNRNIIRLVLVKSNEIHECIRDYNVSEYCFFAKIIKSFP